MDRGVVRAVADLLQIMETVQRDVRLRGAAIRDVASDLIKIQCFFRGIELEKERLVVLLVGAGRSC
jgi:hypothetical protein